MNEPVPTDLLSPIWRCEPNHGSGVFTIALDPREAKVVLERGWATLDGVRYRSSLKGCTGAVDGDERVMIRCEIDEHQAAGLLYEEAESLRRHTYNEALPTEVHA